MSNLFARIKNVVMADLHDVLDQKEHKNPIGTLNQHLRQCEQEVEKVRKLIERQHLLKDEFTREYHQAAELAERRRKQADVALKAGEDELYNFVINEQHEYERRVENLNQSLAQSSQHMHELEQKYEQMQHKLKDMHLRRMELMGRENIVQANYRVNQVTESGDLTRKAQTGFQEMERYIDRLEHRLNSSYHHHTIDARIAQLEKSLKEDEINTVS
ncbi:PspA/IM30 family protein [Bacillus solimangrovi]|uniref:Modulator protein n=1 Tax=Bacillus solimangrovi TaxID=1305675 RepID=A0A1E5LH16_9BACI|nr:PspA/IM30 family protein [Bacillus solimangrovi]OEH93370.1 modulator protein [Bacillus solimangrovi]